MVGYRWTGWALAVALVQMPLSAVAQAAAAAVQEAPSVNADAARPVPPPDADLAGAARIDCRNVGAMAPPEVTQRVRNAIRDLNAMGQYQARLIGWYDDRFIAHGTWTAADASAFARTLNGYPETAGLQMWLMDRFRMANEEQTRLQAAERARDYPAACRALVTMLGHLSEAPERFRASWATVNRVYTAEAQRRGVPLP